MIYTYKFDEESNLYKVFTNGNEILQHEQIRDREDLLYELEKLGPGLLIINKEETEWS